MRQEADGNHPWYLVSNILPSGNPSPCPSLIAPNFQGKKITWEWNKCIFKDNPYTRLARVHLRRLYSFNISRWPEILSLNFQASISCVRTSTIIPIILFTVFLRSVPLQAARSGERTDAGATRFDDCFHEGYNLVPRMFPIDPINIIGIYKNI